MRWIFALVLLIAACQPTPSKDDIVTWDRSPTTILFRADIVGGESDFRARNAVPNCTIYGDNHLVWVNELGPFQIQVLEDRLPDGAISAFVQFLVVNRRVYTYDAHLSDVETQTADTPVVETITLNVNGMEHHGDSLSGWTADWFPNVLNACKSLGTTPILVEPSSGWVTAQSVPFSMQPPVSTWDAQTMGLSLATVADGAPHWITGTAASTLWNMLHSLPSNLIFEDGDNYYEVALQVPGITRDSPPAPASS